jgi:hypothetical protein
MESIELFTACQKKLEFETRELPFLDGINHLRLPFRSASPQLLQEELTCPRLNNFFANVQRLGMTTMVLARKSDLVVFEHESPSTETNHSVSK